MIEILRLAMRPFFQSPLPENTQETSVDLPHDFSYKAARR
jgi:hypothetical protein